MMSERRRFTCVERAEILAAWSGSGMTAAAFAEGRGVSKCTLYAWRRAARAEEACPDGRAAARRAFAEVVVRSDDAGHGSSVNDGDDRDDRIEVVVQDIVVRVGRACDGDALVRVLRAVRQAS